MIAFDAHYMDGKTSRARTVQVFYDGLYLVLRDDTGGILLKASARKAKFTPVLGRTPRKITLENGGQLETSDFKAVKRLEAILRKNQPFALIHSLETHWRAVVISIAVLIFAGWAFIAHGIPALAKSLAFSAPSGVHRVFDAKGYGMLEKRFLRHSALTPEKRAQVEALFDEVVKTVGKSFDYHLRIHASKALGANALALPNGTIIMTDDLIELSENDTELMAIMAHEITHVEERHGLRGLLQHTGIYLVVNLIMGDVFSASSTAAALPMMLLQTGYSRQFEYEADRGAVRFLKAEKLPIKDFESILTRLHEKLPEMPGALNWVSTHPGLKDRLEALEEAAGEKKKKEE